MQCEGRYYVTGELVISFFNSLRYRDSIFLMCEYMCHVNKTPSKIVSDCKTTISGRSLILPLCLASD